MTTLLVAHDFSDCGNAALVSAVDLARTGDQLILLHVHPYEFVRGEHTTGATTYDAEERDRRTLQEMADKLASETPDLETKVSVQLGVPVETILEEATREGVDVIVMGTHGRTGMARLVLGPVAEQVVRAAKVPVMVVKSDSSKQVQHA